MNVSSFFQGSVLKFAVAGEGVSIDPATGAFSVPAAALAAGLTVTVTALDALGVAGQPFRLTIAAAPDGQDSVAPSVLTPPALSGSGRVGEALAIAPGTWGGVPVPAITLQWLRGGAAIEGATGETYVLQAVDEGQAITCRVIARNAAGEIAAEPAAIEVPRTPLPFPPLLLAAPLLAGAGKVGSPLTVDTGSWSGLPAPALSLQWLRDGAAIEGATDAAYLLTDADDRCALACRVTALNSAGSQSAETAALAITQVAPALVGELFDEVFDRDEGSVPVTTAQAFSGRALVYTVAGGGAAIDAATGVLSIPTASAIAEEVAVTATNSGGAATASFVLTIEDPDAFPLMLAATDWSAVEVRDAAPAGRRRISIAPSVVVPEGYELRLYSGPLAGGARDLTNRVMTPGEPYTTNGSVTVGRTCTTLLYWRRIADGEWAPASNPVVFEILGIPATGPTDPTEPAAGEFPAVNQTLGAATQAALKAALDARVASGSTATWVIHLPVGNYGDLNINDYKLPGRTILRSANHPSTGAKFTSIAALRARNVHFQSIHLDRTGLGYISIACQFMGSDGCGFSYSDLNFNTAKVANSGTAGWVQNVGTGIQLWRDNETQTTTRNFTFRHNYVHGVVDCAIWVATLDTGVFEGNVFADTGGDDMQFSNAQNVKFINNWGSRVKYPAFGDSGWKHTDFVQCDSRYVYSENIEFIGNVMMCGPWPQKGIPSQGLFSSKSFTRGWLYRDNIIMTNTPNAICVGASTAGNAEGHTALYNTTLRTIDDLAFATQHDARVAVAGGVNIDYNVMCGLPGATGMGVNGLNIVMKGSTKDYTASRAYHVNPVMAASFYDIRPVEGRPTHWATPGQKLGAFQRFQDVIVGGKYPKVGPAAGGWKASYDPSNQITA